MEEIREKTIDIKVRLNVTINGKPIEEVKKLLNDIINLIDTFNNEVE